MKRKDLLVLLAQARDHLEPLWDCTCSGDTKCERCDFLDRIDRAQS